MEGTKPMLKHVMKVSDYSPHVEEPSTPRCINQVFKQARKPAAWSDVLKDL